ncbi:MAG TPA: hypothetical protein PLA73_02010, partial [Sedimentibacter sp.]|nr:hypothetical protein [Sedimentibacter sp.]
STIAHIQLFMMGGFVNNDGLYLLVGTQDVNGERFILPIQMTLGKTGGISNTMMILDGNEIKEIELPAVGLNNVSGEVCLEYARQNIQVEKQGRPINIKSIELLKFDGNKALLKVRCSKGTYIRTLCNDIGKSLGTFGHMGILIRTESKGLHINNSVTLEKLKYLNDSNKLDECLIPVESIYKLDKINVESKYYDRLTAGNEVEAGLNTDSDKFYVYCRNSLIGIGKKVKDNTIKIDKMLR